MKLSSSPCRLFILSLIPFSFGFSNTRITHCNQIQHKSINDSSLHSNNEFAKISVSLESRSGENISDYKNDRRRFVQLSLLSSCGWIWQGQQVANAVVMDQTDNWVNTDLGSSYAEINQVSRNGEGRIVVSNSNQINQSKRKVSDEFTVVFDKQDIMDGQNKLGLELQNVDFRTNIRVQVKSVQKASLADLLGVSKFMVVVAVNGQSTERTDAMGVQTMVARAISEIRDGTAKNDLEITFRDPEVFLNELRSLKEGDTVTTQVAPAGDTTQRTQTGRAKGSETSQEDQRFTVSQIKPPTMCNKGAKTDDLLEISYVGSVVETGTIFDGSAVTIDGRGIPGRGNDVTLFFVLGKQPFGQFPPGWDVGLVGMCVGERRRIIIPPVLGYGNVGVPRRNIPPNATLQYDVTLVSINGNALPQ